MRGGLARRMQGLEKGYERGGFRWTQILSVRRHIAAALNHLPDELVLREPHGNAVQSRPSLPTAFSKGMAVAALLDLKDQSALPLKRSCAMKKSIRHGITAPCVHVRTPGRELGEMGKRSQRDRDQQHGQNRNRPALPALFSFAGKKGKKKQPNNYDDRADEKCWRLERRREQREQSIEPQEKVIRLGRGLDDGRVGPGRSAQMGRSTAHMRQQPG